ncbi:MAG: sulfotransferase [bacterium]|nr:sulfotransferase [bacterium]
MIDTPLKVLYILGSGRNGSTVLADALGTAPGMENVGEIHWIWDRGAGENRPCGCGEPFADCVFWQGVLSDIAAVAPQPAAERAKVRYATLEGLAPLRLLGRRWANRIRPRQREYLELTRRLYLATAQAAEAEVIVDSSKRPVYGQAITRLEDLDVHIVHLVRDARAVAFSWRRKKRNPDRPDGGYMARYPAWKSAVGWAVWNAMGELLRWRRKDRFLQVRYEDFIRDPQGVLESIGEFIGLEATAALSGVQELMLSSNHSISGNPSKFEKGAIKLREDREWAASMEAKDFWTTTLLTWPLLLRYRYPLGKGH